MLAEVLASVDAVAALAAGVGQPRHRDPLTDSAGGGRRRPSSLDDSDALVTGDEGKAGLRTGQSPSIGMDVGVAQVPHVSIRTSTWPGPGWEWDGPRG